MIISERFSTVVSAVTACALIVALAVGIFSIPRTSEGAPIVAVILTVAVAATGVTIYDYNSCDINLVWGCNKNGGGGLKEQGGGFWQRQENEPAETGNEQTPNTPSGNTPGAGGGASGEICSSAPNACGMVSTGFINQGGQCGTTTPPLSACPAPVIGAAGFYAEPARVKSGNTSTLHWSVTNATECAITGGGLSLAGLGITGQNPTNPIVQQTTFTLTCKNGAAGGPSSQANATVNIVPTFQEI